MVDRAVADALILHEVDDLLEGFEVLRRVSVQLDIGDMARVGQRVVGRFDADLIVRADREIHRDVEAVGVVVAVGHALDLAEAFGVHAHKAARKALCRGA
ncbi:hypothetical protein SDC9_182641 [bioreactor metagenome]|uniref:Uncharacterized protein n=1 Tax=bioreactor metagenome TaxID=1076179 RepID=A0A645H9F8_9ZZZZ